MTDNRDLEVLFNGDDAPQDLWENDDITIEDMDERSETVAKNIGYIVIHFNALDDLVSLVVSDLTFERLGTQDERSAVFLSEMTFSQRAATLMKLYGLRVRFDEYRQYIDRLNEIGRRLTESSRRRNQYAHADWLDSESMTWVKIRTRVSRRRDRVFHQYRSFSDCDMVEDLEYIKQTEQELDEFHEEVFQAMMRSI